MKSTLEIGSVRDDLIPDADSRSRRPVFFAPVATIDPFFTPAPDWEQRVRLEPTNPRPEPIEVYRWFIDEYPVTARIASYGMNRWVGEQVLLLADEFERAATDPRLEVPSDPALAARLLRVVAAATSAIDIPGG